MSKKKTKTSSTSSGTATTTPNVPDWISTPMQGIAGQINNLVGQAPVVTPMSALQRQAFSTAGGLLSGNSNIGDAQSATRGLLDYTPGNVDAGQLSTTDLNPYMNPYQQQVIDSLIGDFGHANDVGLNSLRSMTPNGAYGGSRQMVAAGQMVGDNARTLAGTVASLRNQGYQNAQQAALTDIGNRLSADQFNVNSGLAGANLRLGAANQLGQQGLASDANNRANLGLMADLGGQERGIADESNPTTYMARLLQLLQGTNPGLFTGQTINSSGRTSGQTTESGGWLGDIGTILQAAAAMGGGGAPVPSDRRLKTDAHVVGTDAKGLRWWRYRYVWDEPGTERIGVMADEAPAHAVHRHESGYLMVDYGAL